MLRACLALSTLMLAACGDSSATPTGGAGGAPTAGSAPGGSNEGGSSGDTAGGGPQGGSADGGAGNVGGAPPACDGDGDESLLTGAGCCGAPDLCDCDDNDSNVYPAQDTFFDVPRPFEDDPILMWDYDCNGVAEKQYAQSANGCGPLACVATTTEFQGNNGDYFCGAPGTLIICAGIGLQCTVQGGVTLACK